MDYENTEKGLGVWWIARPNLKSDYECELVSDSPSEPPDWKIPGLFRRGEEGLWNLVTYGELKAASRGLPIRPDPLLSDENALVIHGDCVSSTKRSLFGADCIAKSTRLDGMPNEEEWSGWCDIEASQVWVNPGDEVVEIQITFDVLNDWVGKGKNDYTGWDVSEFWDYRNQRIEVPESRIFEAEFEDCRIGLVHGPKVRISMPTVQMSFGARLVIEETLPVANIYHKWVVPFRDLLGFLTLRYVSVSNVAAKMDHPDESIWIDINYSDRVGLDSHTPRGHVQSRIEMLVTHGRLEEADLPFDTLVRGFFALQHSSHVNAIRHLNSSHNANIDRSDESQLLNAVKALEFYCKGAKKLARKLNRKVEAVIEDTVTAGEKVVAIWQSSSRDFASDVPKLRNLAAHGGGALSADEQLEIWMHAIALRWIMRDVYLSQIGLSSENVNAILMDCHLFENDLGLLERYVGGS